MQNNLSALRRSSGENIPSPRPSFFRKNLAVIFTALPLGILFLTLIYLFQDFFLPAEKVEVARVVTLPTEKSAAPGVRNEPADKAPFQADVLFQASGWFEADPLPVRATALVDGVIESVEVLEGEAVKAGQVIARLIDDDARLALETARADLQAAQARLASSRADLDLALASRETARAAIATAEARLSELRDLAKRANQLGDDTLPEQDIAQANLRVETQEARIRELKARLKGEQAAVEKARQAVQLQESLVDRTESEVAIRKLAFDRTRVRAPMEGVIQSLHAAPGRKKHFMGENPESATVALIVDPDSLQARIDVALAEAGRLRTGQAVLVTSEFLPEATFEGIVDRIVGEADLQRNTLQAKVRILNPDPRLRPEMLCRAKFLDARPGSERQPPAEPGIENRPASTGGLSLLVPENALLNRSGEEPGVFAVGPDGKRAVFRPISTGSLRREGFVEVNDGLRPGDRVLLNPSSSVQDGDRIQFNLKD